MVASKKDGGGKLRFISWFSQIIADEKIDLVASGVVDVKPSDVVDENVVLLDVNLIRGLMKMSESTAVV